MVLIGVEVPVALLQNPQVEVVYGAVPYQVNRKGSGILVNHGTFPVVIPEPQHFVNVLKNLAAQGIIQVGVKVARDFMAMPDRQEGGDDGAQG